MTLPSPHRAVVFVLGVMILAGDPLLAQRTGEIEGRVFDTQGGPLSGVTVVLEGPESPGS